MNGKAEVWTMPLVEKGQIVFWRYHKSVANPNIGIVTAVGHSTINVHVIDSGLKDFSLKTGVRHVSDPFLLQSQISDGVWELTPRDILINSLLAEKLSIKTPGSPVKV